MGRIVKRSKTGIVLGTIGGVAAGVGTAVLLAPVIGILITVAVAALGMVYMKVIRPSIAQSELMRNGEKAEATILEVRQNANMHVMVNGALRMEFLLSVNPGLGTPYEVEVVQLIPAQLIPHLHPNVRVPVRIHPKHKKRVVIDLTHGGSETQGDPIGYISSRR